MTLIRDEAQKLVFMHFHSCCMSVTTANVVKRINLHITKPLETFYAECVLYFFFHVVTFLAWLHYVVGKLSRNVTSSMKILPYTENRDLDMQAKGTF